MKEMQLMNTEELTTRYKTTDRSIRRWIQSRKFPVPCKYKGKNYWNMNDVLQWEAAQPSGQIHRSMDLNYFWELVENARKEGNGDMGIMFQSLRGKLWNLDIPELIVWEQILFEYLRLACKYEIALAGKIITLHYNRHKFYGVYFQSFLWYLFAMGRAAFCKILSDPDSLAEIEFHEIDVDLGAYWLITTMIHVKRELEANPDDTARDNVGNNYTLPLDENILWEISKSISHKMNPDVFPILADGSIKALLPRLYEKYINQ